MRVPDEEGDRNLGSESDNDTTDGGPAMTNDIPAAISEDPFFARLLRNAESYGKDSGDGKEATQVSLIAHL